jgi:hypothetical protein
MKMTKEQRDTLAGVLTDIWAMLKRGVDHFRDPFHCPVLGSIGKEGPSLRRVILRQCRLPERILVCHTDSRAKKVSEIGNTDQVSWLFYHPKKGIQLRVSGKATLHVDDPFADDQWVGTSITSRLNYCATQPPGTPVDRPSSGLPDFLLNKIPTFLESERGRQNFTAIACGIDSIDWVSLSLLGNRRARFVWDNNELSSQWLIP